MTPHQRRRAIKALNAAYSALGATLSGDEGRDDSRVQLRSDINEFLSYLEAVEAADQRRAGAA